MAVCRGVKMPDLCVINRPLASLRPYERNPRKNDQAVPRMVEILQEFGFRVPILAKSDGEIIDGHLRYKAAMAMGLNEVPVIIADDLSEAQIRAFRIMINRSASWAEWDEGLLVEELRAIELSELDIKFTGFDADELARLLPRQENITENLPGEEDIPEPASVPVTQTGDLWLLGDHALYCGDAGDKKAVSVLMGNDLARFCFTSPPYGQQRDYAGKIYDWDGLMRKVFGSIPLAREGQLLINLGLIRKQEKVVRYWDGWLDWMETVGWRLYDWYAWDQGSGLPGTYNAHLAPCHEWIFHFNREITQAQKTVPCKLAGQNSHVVSSSGKATAMRDAKGKVGRWRHTNTPTQEKKIPDSVIRIRRQVGSIGEGIDHPAVFPVALPEFLIPVWTEPGDIVFEPFCGSGSSIIAAQKTGRVARAMEIAPAYVDVSLIRFGRLFPDVKITLKETGQSFEQIAEMRKGGSNES